MYLTTNGRSNFIFSCVVNLKFPIPPNLLSPSVSSSPSLFLSLSRSINPEDKRGVCWGTYSDDGTEMRIAGRRKLLLFDNEDVESG